MQLPSDSVMAAMVRRAQAHDLDAFEQLYKVFADPLYRYCYVRSGDSTTAQQLVGDVFAQMAQGMRQYRIPKQAHASDLCGWIFRLAEQHLALTTTSQATSQPASQPKPSAEAAVAPQRDSRLRDAIRSLPTEQQQVVLLRCVEQRSAAEVAATLGMTIGRVRALQQSALAALAGQIGPPKSEASPVGERGATAEQPEAAAETNIVEPAAQPVSTAIVEAQASAPESEAEAETETRQ